jgi:hypothetical protein
MKNRNFLFVLAMSMACTTMSAQNKATTPKQDVDMSEWQSFYIQYNSMPLEYSVKNIDDLNFNGVTMGYSKALNVTKATPLFVEIGMAAQAVFYTDDEDSNWDYKYRLFSLIAPVSLVYKWTVSKDVKILPYAGLLAKYRILGKAVTEYTGSNYEYYHKEEEDYNLFDKKDMGGKDYTWNHFQLGYQIGVNIMLNNSWHIGVSYGKDFSEVVKKAKFSTTSITLGIDF